MTNVNLIQAGDEWIVVHMKNFELITKSFATIELAADHMVDTLKVDTEAIDAALTEFAGLNTNIAIFDKGTLMSTVRKYV